MSIFTPKISDDFLVIGRILGFCLSL